MNRNDDTRPNTFESGHSTEREPIPRFVDPVFFQRNLRLHWWRTIAVSTVPSIFPSGGGGAAAGRAMCRAARPLDPVFFPTQNVTIGGATTYLTLVVIPFFSTRTAARLERPSENCSLIKVLVLYAYFDVLLAKKHRKHTKGPAHNSFVLDNPKNRLRRRIRTPHHNLIETDHTKKAL